MIFFIISLFSLLLPDDCKNEDVGIAYSACDSSSSTRDIAFYWKKACNSTTVKLPNPNVLEKVACSFGCNNGRFFNSSIGTCSTNTSSCCSACANGSSADSGEVYIREWKNLPDTFTSPNNAWRPDEGGFGLTTGIMPPNSVARLDIELDIISTSGSLLYEYVGFNTGFGSTLYLLYDDEPFETNALPLTGHQGTWLLYGLDYGKHKVSFVYQSPIYEQSTVEGARLTYAYEYGTTHMSSVCTPCAPRMYSSNSNRCEYCGMDTYADVAGLAACKPCDPDTQYAFPGADQCSSRTVCTKNDYQARHTACDANGKMTVYYELQPYPICAENADSKPANETKDCPKCNPGLKKENSTCVACPVGEYREDPDSDDSKCTQCPAGTVTLKTLYFKNIDPLYFSTNCESFTYTSIHCSSGGAGWSSEAGVTTSGNFYSGPVSTFLTTNISGAFGVTIEFRYRVHLQYGSFFAYWPAVTGSSNAMVPVTVNSSQNSNEWTKVEIPYFQDTFTWSFHKRSLGYTTQGKVSDYVEIDYIAFHGLSNATGGATTCRKCENGSYSVSGSTQCTQCDPGSAAVSGDGACTPCAGETYASTAGMAECLPCGNSNVAARNHTGCDIATCGLTYNETHVFDLTPLLSHLNADGRTDSTDTMAGPVEVAEWPIGAFYLGVCQTENSKSYCRSGDGETATAVESLLCEVSTNPPGVYPVGNKTNITYFENTDANEYGVNITYYDGEYFYQYEYITFTGNRAAEVLFVCMPGAGVGKPQKPKTLINHTHASFITPPHTYHFRWETDYACRLCRLPDYTGTQGECVDGRQTTTYWLNPDVKCTGGVPPPESTVAACKVPLVTMNGGVLALIIVGAVVVVIIVVVVLVVLIRSNRKLKYQLVQKENLSVGGVGVGSGGTSPMVSFGGKN